VIFGAHMQHGDEGGALDFAPGLLFGLFGAYLLVVMMRGGVYDHDTRLISKFCCTDSS